MSILWFFIGIFVLSILLKRLARTDRIVGPYVFSRLPPPRMQQPDVSSDFVPVPPSIYEQPFLSLPPAVEEVALPEEHQPEIRSVWTAGAPIAPRPPVPPKKPMNPIPILRR